MDKNSPNTSKKIALNMNDIELVFGTPNSPKSSFIPIHHITDETKQNDKNNDDKKKNTDSDTESTQPTQPLLEPSDKVPLPPLAGPEIDDLDDDHSHTTAPFPGIDDGLSENRDNKSDTPKEGGENADGDPHNSNPMLDEGVGTEDGKWPWTSQDEADGPYGDINGFDNRFGVDDNRPISPALYPASIPDVNTYQQKKNLAQGMMDLALLSANANQLRYVLESKRDHPYFYPSLTMIYLSIILQVAVGVGLILNSRYNVKDDKDICKADKINNMTVLGIFLITIVNVFITSFSVPPITQTVAVAPVVQTVAVAPVTPSSL